jgi:imidazolonepropionase
MVNFGYQNRVTMRILIKNIKELIQTEASPQLKVCGKDMKSVGSVKDAWLTTENGSISGFGTMESCPGSSFDQTIDASGKMVLPAWCDSHTHLVYAGSREGEFEDRINGLTYEEIAKNGGGILNSALRLQQASEEELFESAMQRLEEIKDMGTGAVEIKSGYGLSTESELKMLRVIKRMKAASPLLIKANFLAAHAIPKEYAANRNGYIDQIINDMLPVVEREQLADYIDVFCDKGFYTPEETDRILKAGIQHGLRPKIHANELDYSGGVQVGVQNNALSVDHLECVGEEEIKALLNTETMPTLLPSTAFFLRLVYPPARKLIDAGLPVALASDYNPGSSPSGKMSFVLSLACIYMGMTPEEAINAATINAAYAMGISDTHGSICVGKRANLIITKAIPSLAFLPYAFGSNLIDQVLIQE